MSLRTTFQKAFVYSAIGLGLGAGEVPSAQASFRGQIVPVPPNAPFTLNELFSGKAPHKLRDLLNPALNKEDKKQLEDILLSLDKYRVKKDILQAKEIIEKMRAEGAPGEAIERTVLEMAHDIAKKVTEQINKESKERKEFSARVNKLTGICVNSLIALWTVVIISLIATSIPDKP